MVLVVTEFQVMAVVDYHHIDKVAFLKICTVKLATRNPPELVLLLFFGNSHEETLHLVDDGGHSGIER